MLPFRLMFWEKNRIFWTPGLQFASSYQSRLVDTVMANPNPKHWCPEQDQAVHFRWGFSGTVRSKREG